MANHLESVRVLWSSTDEQFFRIAAALFPPAFLRGAGVLLASNDTEVESPLDSGDRDLPAAHRETSQTSVAP